jgi:hypothetical protein
MHILDLDHDALYRIAELLGDRDTFANFRRVCKLFASITGLDTMTPYYEYRKNKLFCDKGLDMFLGCDCFELMSVIESGNKWFGLKHGNFDISFDISVDEEGSYKYIMNETYCRGKLVKVCNSSGTILQWTPKYTYTSHEHTVYWFYKDYLATMEIKHPIYSYNHVNKQLIMPFVECNNRIPNIKSVSTYSDGGVEKHISCSKSKTVIYYGKVKGTYTKRFKSEKRYERIRSDVNIKMTYKFTKIEELYEERSAKTGILLAKYHRYKGVVMERYRIPDKLLKWISLMFVRDPVY